LGGAASAAYFFWPPGPAERLAAGAADHKQADRRAPHNQTIADAHGEQTADHDEGSSHRQSENVPTESSESRFSTSESDGEARTTTQPGSVVPDKSADLYAKVSGYLKQLGEDRHGKPIDIGSRVKAGDELAVIDMPELVKQVKRDRAALKRSEATVKQMRARIDTAEADFRAAKKMHSFRTKVYNRMYQLAKVEKAMDYRVVDEREEQMHAAEETKNAAEAKIAQAQADLEEALAEVDLAQANLEKAEVDLDYAKIISPYDGVITARNYWPGDFIRAHEEGGGLPLLTVEKTDVMRVRVDIPDDDVPFVHSGNKAKVTIDNLPGRTFEGVVSRIANAEDPQTRTMRVEIDLENPRDELRNGMYGEVTIVLDDGKNLAESP
jgi:multidrug resistance efflux pump